LAEKHKPNRGKPDKNHLFATIKRSHGRPVDRIR
jgi:hypothetical protein